MKKITKTVRMLEGRIGIIGTRCTEVGVCVCVSLCVAYVSPGMLKYRLDGIGEF